MTTRSKTNTDGIIKQYIYTNNRRYAYVVQLLLFR